MTHSFKGKNNSADSVPEKDLMADIIDKNFKTAILKMLQKLKEDVEKVKKMMCEQNIYINKEIRNAQEIENLKINQKEFWS